MCSCPSGWTGANCETGTTAVYKTGTIYIHYCIGNYNMCTHANHWKPTMSLHCLQILMNAPVTPVNATTIVITLMDGISVHAKMTSCLALTHLSLTTEYIWY